MVGREFGVTGLGVASRAWGPAWVSKMGISPFPGENVDFFDQVKHVKLQGWYFFSCGDVTSSWRECILFGRDTYGLRIHFSVQRADGRCFFGRNPKIQKVLVR